MSAGGDEDPVFGMLPQRLSLADFDKLAVQAVELGASDLTLQSERALRVQIHGRQRRGSVRQLSGSEVEELLRGLYRADNAPAEVKSGRTLDFSYDIRLDRARRQRFRVNATGILARGADGVEITLRVLPTRTPTWREIGLPEELLPALSPRNGIVVIAGATGQGKSTTLAAVIRMHLEASGRPRKIVDLQAPIEFTYEDVLEGLGSSASLIGQSEVPRHVESFAAGVRSGLRRAPDIILVGESRDRATIEASLEAALTGHLVYTTTHAGSVAETMRRLPIVFAVDDREARAFDLATSLKVVIAQQLLPKVGGGRVPAREYLVFDDTIKEQLFGARTNEWGSIITRILAQPPARTLCRSMVTEVDDLHRQGLISRDEQQRFHERREREAT